MSYSQSSLHFHYPFNLLSMIHPSFLWTFLAFAPLSLMAQREFVHISTADYVVSDSLPLFTQELAVEQGNLHHEVALIYPE